jgi:hypothetical protein
LRRSIRALTAYYHKLAAFASVNRSPRFVAVIGRIRCSKISGVALRFGDSRKACNIRYLIAGIVDVAKVVLRADPN